MITETIAKVKTQIPGPNSKKLLEQRKAAVARGVSYSTELFVKEAKGALIKDVDDNVFIDFAAGIGVINTGHCDEEIVEAIKEQVEKYIHTSFNVVMYEPYIRLAEKLNSLVPGTSKKKTMFANSGAEAVENAVKIARKYTGKSGVVTLDGSFHGRTFMTMTMTSKVIPYKDGFAPFAADHYKIPAPNVYRNPFGNDEDTVAAACADEFEAMLKTTLNSDMIACVVIEPVQGEGGFVPMPKEYLRRMQKICNKNKIVFIMDEIQAGFARTGSLFCCEQAGIEPDMITLSKSIAAGLPISAVVGKEEIMDAPIPGAIGGTFSGNPVACVAALKVLEKIEKDQLSDRAIEIGAIIMNRLEELKGKYLIIGDVRGRGAMVGVEFVKDRNTKEPYKEAVSKIIELCLQEGVIYLNCGILGNCIRFLPPLVMADEQLEYGLDVLERAIKTIC